MNSGYDISALFEAAKNIPPYPSGYSGRGIVISAGGKYLPSSYVAVRSLRAAGCTLPIQLWYLGHGEFPPILHPIFAQLGVEPIDAFAVRNRFPIRTLGGWESKPYSIMHSPFKEVFSFDADNVALLNPEFLFDLPEFRQHGSMFWPDFPCDHGEYWMIKPEAWELFGLTPRRGEELEVGQVLIDKEKSWAALCVAYHMNANSDFFYPRCSHGDKDTYTLAWLYMRQSRYRVPHTPKLLEEWVRIQYAPDGRELFQHARKWVLPPELNPHLVSYQKEDECMGWLAEYADAFNSVKRTLG